MGPRLVPGTIIAALTAFAVAAGTAALVPYWPSLWPAVVSLAILGGITPMIYAVNIRLVPVFARRAWPEAGWLRWQVGLALAGAWTVYGGRLTDQPGLVTLGSALALGAGIVFTINVVRLFRRPAVGPALPTPHPNQAMVDRIATRFTRLAGFYLLVGLGVGFALSIWQPATGRWDLVWAHAMLIGFFLSMAAGVGYHVLPRWTGRPWRSAAPIRLHLLLAAVATPAMLVALATDRTELFAVTGILQVAALALYLATIAPMLPALPGPTRPALIGAAFLLLAGIALGAAFAIEPALGARFRLAHAQLNLFGWGGLLISAIGAYLFPQFAGRPLRWPRLVTVQLAAIGGGVTIGTLARLWLMLGDPSARGELLTLLGAVALGLVALGFLLFGAIVFGTFASARGGGGTVGMLNIVPADGRLAAGVRVGSRSGKAIRLNGAEVQPTESASR